MHFGKRRECYVTNVISPLGHILLYVAEFLSFVVGLVRIIATAYF